MNSSLTLGVLITAGVTLVIQNLLMVRITASVSTVIITLLVNSGVGLVLLLSTLLVRNGPAGLVEVAGAFKPWFLLPGLLGTFFVFASIQGYQHVGAAVTISTLVASQMVAGLLADGLKSGVSWPRIEPLAALGAVLLVAGVFLIARSRG